MAVFQIVNKLDKKIYSALLESTDKLITVSFSAGTLSGRVDERNHVVCQAAVYPGTGTSGKPLFFVNLTDKIITKGSGSEIIHNNKNVTKEAFIDFIKKILANEKIEDLAAGVERVYLKYGFWSNHCSIRPLFALTAVDNVFVNQKEDAAPRPEEIG